MVNICKRLARCVASSRCDQPGRLRRWSAHTGVEVRGFQRLGSKSLTLWFFMAGNRLNASVRYSWGLMPRRRQLWIRVQMTAVRQPASGCPMNNQRRRLPAHCGNRR